MNKAIDKLIAEYTVACEDEGYVPDQGLIDSAMEEVKRLSAIEQAALALIKCKGRYHAELNTNALAVALGIELPYTGSIDKPEPFGYFRAEPFGWTDCSEDDEGAIALYEHPPINQVDDIDVVDLKEPLQVKMADILAIQLEEAKRGNPYNHGLYNGMLYMVAAHDGGEYKPISKEDMYIHPSAITPIARSISDQMMDLADRLGALEEVDIRAWQHLLVYAPDYKDISMDAARFRWLMADHKGEEKRAARSIISTLSVSSLSSARLNIDANIEEATKTRPSAIELQDTEIGIPELVTELINPHVTIQRYTFDRYVKRKKMAEGISVHAANMDEAEQKAKKLMRDDTDEIKFRDNSPCVTQHNCKHCKQ